MNPEPLKNKRIWIHHLYNDKAKELRIKNKQEVTPIQGFHKEDVKLAVQWLKEQIKDISIKDTERKLKWCNANGVLLQIEKAFPDFKEK